MDVKAILVVLTMFAGFDVARVGAKDDLNALPPGHLEPFGSHRPAEGDVDSLDTFPDPKTFYEKYFKIGKPVLFKGAAKKIPAFKLWTDKYLAEKYGDLVVDFESGKKENRSHAMNSGPLRKFLEIYKEDDIYMVQDVLQNMKGDLSMLKPIMCGGFSLEIAVMWFSSGNTKSVLHTDSIENINCIFDGYKDIAFVDKSYKEVVERVGWRTDGSFSDMDVERVDMKTYGHLAEVPWWRARMEKGDCLYIPFLWYHTVASSPSRNLACNLWFDPLLRFNDSDCAQLKQPLPDYDTLNKYQFNKDPLAEGSHAESIRYNAFEAFRDLEEMRLSDIMPEWTQHMSEDDVTKVFAQIDINKDQVLSWDEVMKADVISIAEHVRGFVTDLDMESYSAMGMGMGGGEGEEGEDGEEGVEGVEEGEDGAGEEVGEAWEEGGKEASKDEL